jgi:DNA-binding transcriptional LysR family regulator
MHGEVVIGEPARIGPDRLGQQAVEVEEVLGRVPLRRGPATSSATAWIAPPTPSATKSVPASANSITLAERRVCACAAPAMSASTESEAVSLSMVMSEALSERMSSRRSLRRGRAVSPPIEMRAPRALACLAVRAILRRMNHWTELRTALTLARHGTVSAAAEALGLHRATVSRHVETLEGVFGAPLFQKHARGYALTDTGRDMLEVASRADEMFADLAGRARGQAGRLSGSLVVTALGGVAPLVMPAVRAFHLAHPEIALEFLAGAQLARLEHGEAHAAIRAGPKPREPDYVVTLFRTLRFGLYASQDYVAGAGHPDPDRLEGHRFVGSVGSVGTPSPLPYAAWMEANVPPAALALRTTEPLVLQAAVCEGLGLGFLAEHDAAVRPDLVEVVPPGDAWSVPLWTVTHVDLHRTAKVQTFLKALKALARADGLKSL